MPPLYACFDLPCLQSFTFASIAISPALLYICHIETTQPKAGDTMTSKQREAKETAQWSFPLDKQQAIVRFICLLGYDLYSVKEIPSTWKEAVERFK